MGSTLKLCAENTRVISKCYTLVQGIPNSRDSKTGCSFPRRPAAAPLVLLAGAAGARVIASDFGRAAFDAGVTAKRIVVHCSVTGALGRILRRSKLRPPRPLCCDNPLAGGG